MMLDILCSVAREIGVKNIFPSATILLLISGVFFNATAQQNNQLNAQTLKSNVTVSYTPRAATFTEGSTFEVPVMIDTDGSSINSMEIEVRFDPKKISVVSPSGGRSIIGVWIEPPSYDNTKGVVRFVGAIPGGITADAGLIATITFRANAVGDTSLTFASNSQVLMNDGYGTSAETTFGRATYTISGKPPEGIQIYSETHPNTNQWYNNDSPMFTWDAGGADGVSYVLDTSPLTSPESSQLTTDSFKGYADLKDGTWYFHLKVRKNGAWGSTTHYPVKIDTAPPADFAPHIDYIAAAAAAFRGLVSFETTDALSGIDHYEVGVLDSANADASPVFIQTESPFRVPESAVKSRVIVRAFDAAGNTRDASIDVDTSSLISLAMANMWTLIFAGAFVLLLALVGIHYLVRHHIIMYLRDAYRLFRKEQHDDEMREESGGAPPSVV